MERIKTLETRNMCESAKNGGCGECQTSCQSACKTSCGVANQKIFPTQGSNPLLLSLLNCRQILYHLCHLGS